ncbi:MAG TPA: VCBS repeat-containing protein, partial [Acidobacteriota bacterium]|nr:VCBS repeat-containing protein [Acidobacteriota bacterium]
MTFWKVPLARFAAALATLSWISLSSGSSSGSKPFIFENLAARAGLSFKENNFATETKFPFETMGGAVAALDFNNDGLLDLFFLNGAPSPEHLRTDPATFNRLYRNNGDGTFTDVTLQSGLSGQGIKGYPQGVAVGDYDND